MSKKTTGIIFATVVSVALACVGITTTNDLTNSAFAQDQKFRAQLTGNQEVPPTNSQGTGMAEFTVMADRIEYTVNASGMQGVTAGHIHVGAQGENGPVIVTLFQNEPPTNEVSETGSITPDKLEGPLADTQLTDLATEMSNGETYVNVHTEQNPEGEIRGQIAAQ